MAETLQEMARRLCTGRGCFGCPIREAIGEKGACMIDTLRDCWTDPTVQIEALKEWADANPVRTYWDDMCEKFPVIKDKPEDVFLFGCISKFYFDTVQGLDCPPGGCKDCWNAPFGSIKPPVWVDKTPVWVDKTPKKV